VAGKMNWETATRALLGRGEPTRERKKGAITLPRLKFMDRPMPPDVALPAKPRPTPKRRTTSR
jgi:hypothetical protein